MATETTNNVTPEAPAKGFENLCCIKCGQPDGCMLDLESLDKVYCTHCEDDFSLVDEVKPFLAQWARLLKWVQMSNDIQG